MARINWSADTDEVWDDLRAPAQEIANTDFAPGAAAADRDVDGSLLFDAAAIETCSLLLQLPHTYMEGSNIRPHIHWSKTTADAGDVVWGMIYRWANLGDVFPAYSAVVTGVDSPHVGVEIADQHGVTEFGTTGNEIDGTGKEISSMLVITIGRLATNPADNYPGDAKLWEFDLHFRVDSMGSELEFSKTR